ncbi:MAG: hypothetical protein ACRDQF_02495 [Thermocrispum sp.]
MLYDLDGQGSIHLDPTGTSSQRLAGDSPERHTGANQATAAEWTTSWDRGAHGSLVFVVRNSSRWATEDTEQSYALAVVLEASEEILNPYAEMHARFEALAETEPEIE